MVKLLLVPNTFVNQFDTITEIRGEITLRSPFDLRRPRLSLDFLESL
jgi:hypothetical protein